MVCCRGSCSLTCTDCHLLTGGEQTQEHARQVQLQGQPAGVGWLGTSIVTTALTAWSALWELLGDEDEAVQKMTEPLVVAQSTLYAVQRCIAKLPTVAEAAKAAETEHSMLKPDTSKGKLVSCESCRALKYSCKLPSDHTSQRNACTWKQQPSTVLQNRFYQCRMRQVLDMDV